MKSRRKNLEAKVLLAFSRQKVAAAEAHAFECHESTGYQFTVEFFHVTDKRGRHRFINANEFTIKHFGGTEAFKEILGRQFQAFESIGTILATRSEENSQEVMISDPDAAYRIDKRIEEIRNLYPNSTNYLEPWLPRSEEETAIN